MTVLAKWHGVSNAQVIVTDIPAGSECEAYLRQLRADAPRASIVVWGPIVPGYAEAAGLYRRWLLPATELDDIARAMHEALAAEPVFLTASPRLVGPSLGPSFIESADRTLTRRELELISAFDPTRRVVLTRRQLAMRMNLTVPAVRYHVRNLLKKTGSPSLQSLQRIGAQEIVELAQLDAGARSSANSHER